MACRAYSSPAGVPGEQAHSVSDNQVCLAAETAEAAKQGAPGAIGPAGVQPTRVMYIDTSNYSGQGRHDALGDHSISGYMFATYDSAGATGRVT